LDPRQKTRLEPLGIQPSKHPAKRIVGRDAVGQFEERSQPRQLGVPEQLNLDPIIGTADDGANRNDKDVGQRMQLRPFNPRIFQTRKVLVNRRSRLVVHGYPPGG